MPFLELYSGSNRGEPVSKSNPVPFAQYDEAGTPAPVGTAADPAHTEVVDSSGASVAYTDEAGYPGGATVLNSASGNKANASAAATLAAATGQRTYLSGFDVTFTGATAASAQTVTITGLIGGTRSYTVGVPAGVTTAGVGLNFRFDPPLPASADNTAIVVTLPALGAGNTNATVNANGFSV